MRMRMGIGLMLCLLSPVAHAAEVAGVKFEDRITLRAGGATLVLNGAGLRTKVIFKVYAAGLYLTERKPNAAAVLALSGPKRVSMVMLRDLKAEDLVNALNEGMEKNNSAADLDKLKSQTSELTRTMADIGEARKGDNIALDFLPESGTQVIYNGEAKGKPIAGGEFYTALLRVWLGDNPVEGSLKSALLGQGG